MVKSQAARSIEDAFDCNQTNQKGIILWKCLIAVGFWMGAFLSLWQQRCAKLACNPQPNAKDQNTKEMSWSRAHTFICFMINLPYCTISLSHHRMFEFQTSAARIAHALSLYCARAQQKHDKITHASRFQCASMCFFPLANQNETKIHQHNWT